MAECHPAGDESGGIPIEQGKLQHREERESRDICAARRHTASHFCAAVPKSCKKKEKNTYTFQAHHTYVACFSPRSVMALFEFTPCLS